MKDIISIYTVDGVKNEVAGESGTQKLGITRSALVCEVRTEAGWAFRRTRDRQLREIINSIETHQLSESRHIQDIVLWRKNENEFCNQFSTSQTWKQIRVNKPIKPWTKVIWFSLGVPRFAFITWLAVNNRLSTGDRMRSWGQVQGCLSCGEPNETRDLPFFACPYTYTLWIEVVGTLLGRPPDPDWGSTLEHLTTHSFSYLGYILLRLVFQASIYMIWRERNDRRHLKKPRQHHQLAKIIDKTVRNRFLATTYWEKQRLRGFMQEWYTTHT